MKLFSYLAITIALIMVGCTTTPTPIVITATAAPTAISTATPKPSLAEGDIIFTRYDGKKFVGTAYGQGETAIILANMSQGGESQWAPFVEAADKQKFTVITFNYLQLFADDYAAVAQEAEIVLKTLKDFGYKSAICMGASLGVTACSAIAHTPEMVGIVMISGPNNLAALDTAYPKLFIASELDEWSAATKRDYNNADEPKTLTIYPEIGSHGTDLFYSTVKDQFLNALLDFVNAIP